MNEVALDNRNQFRQGLLLLIINSGG